MFSDRTGSRKAADGYMRPKHGRPRRIAMKKDTGTRDIGSKKKKKSGKKKKNGKKKETAGMKVCAVPALPERPAAENGTAPSESGRKASAGLLLFLRGLI